MFTDITRLELTLRSIGYSPNTHLAKLTAIISNPNSATRDVIAASRELRTIIGEAQPKTKLTAHTRDSHGNEFTVTQTQPASDLIAQLGAIRDRNANTTSIARVVPPLRTILDAQPARIDDRVEESPA